MGTHEKVIVNRFSLKDNYAVSVKNNINEHYTLTLCQSASGRFIRPLLIILLKKVPEELKIYSETFHLIANPSGWMTCDIFNIWVNEVFLSEVDILRHYSNAPNAKVTLIVDNHLSRYNPVALRALVAKNVDAVGLVPHSSYFAQPLDLFANNAIKHDFSMLYKEKQIETAKERRIAILDCLRQAIPKVSSQVDALQDAFKRACIRPWNSNGLLEHSGVSKDVHINQRKRHKSISLECGGILTDVDFIETLEKK